MKTKKRLTTNFDAFKRGGIPRAIPKSETEEMLDSVVGAFEVTVTSLGDIYQQQILDGKEQEFFEKFAQDIFEVMREGSQFNPFQIHITKGNPFSRDEDLSYKIVTIISIDFEEEAKLAYGHIWQKFREDSNCIGSLQLSIGRMRTGKLSTGLKDMQVIEDACIQTSETRVKSFTQFQELKVDEKTISPVGEIVVLPGGLVGKILGTEIPSELHHLAYGN